MMFQIKTFTFIGILIFCILYFNESNAQIYIKDLAIKMDSINKTDEFGKQGRWYYYNSNNGMIEAIMSYSNNILDGYFELYWINIGTIQARGFYKNGELDSLYKTYWQNGKIREIYQVQNGKAHGIMQTFDKDSNLLTYNFFIEGKMDTNFKNKFRAKGVIVENGQFLKIDTIKDESKYIPNKNFYIYKNDLLYKEMALTGHVLNRESYYNENGKEVKRIIFYDKKPYSVNKIFYADNGVIFKAEYYDKKGKYTHTEIKNNEGKWIEDKNITAPSSQSSASISEE